MEILHVSEPHDGSLLFRPLNHRVRVFRESFLAMPESQQDEMPADGLLLESHAAWIVVPLSIPMQDLKPCGLRNILSIDFRKISRRIAHLGVAHVGQQPHYSKMVHLHTRENVIG